MPSTRLEWLLVVVSLALASLCVLPLLWLLVLSFGGEGAQRVREVMAQPQTGAVIVRSVLLAAAVALASVCIALPTAWLTHASDMPLRRFFRGATILPLAVPSYVSGFVVVALLSPGSQLAGWLARAGIRLPEVYGPTGVFLALLFMYPLALLPIQASLERMNPRQWEAARSLGSGAVMAWWRVVFPQVRNSALGGGLLVALYVLSDFGAVSLLRFPTLSYAVYQRYRSPFGREESLGYALLLVGLALTFVVIERLLRRRSAPARATTRALWPVIRLGRWRWVAFGWCTLLVVLSAALPVGTILWWLVRGLSNAAPMSWVGSELGTTVMLALSVTALTLLLALAPALLVQGTQRSVGFAARGAAMMGYAMPGIVVALAFVFFGLRGVPSLYQTTWMLLLAYSVRFLPLALQSAMDGVETQPANLHAAARSLGASQLGAWRRVTVPQAGPMLLAGGVAVFVSVMKELPITLLLSPPDTQTLATRVWSWTAEAYLAAAALPALLLVSVAALGLALRPQGRVGRERSSQEATAPLR